MFGNSKQNLLPNSSLMLIYDGPKLNKKNLRIQTPPMETPDPPNDTPGGLKTGGFLGSPPPKKKKNLRQKFTTLRIIGPSKLAILRTLSLLYRFKPFHWRVQDP